MKPITQFALAVVSILFLLTCDRPRENMKMTFTNPLMKEWSGPYGGVPAFDSMKLSDLTDGLERGMEISLTNYDEIAGNPESPTFDNTIVPMENAGAVLDKVDTYYGIWSANLSSPEFREIQNKMAPKIADFESKVVQNEKLFARLKSVYDASREKPLPPDQQRVVQLNYETFAMSGAALDTTSKKRYAEIEKELSTLHTKFSNNVLADEENYVTYFTNGELSGLPESVVKSAAKAAADRGKEGMYAITNTRSSMDPFLPYADKRALREKIWKTFYARGDNGDAYDNNAIIANILKLRQERVVLLGNSNYAQWRLQNRMAKAPERAMEMMKAVWPAAIARVKEEVAEMQIIANQDKIKIEP